MSNDPIADALARTPEPDDITGIVRLMPRIGATLEPKLIVMCATPDYTTDDMVVDKETVVAQWCADMTQQGYHMTADAVEMHWNAPGGFEAVGPEHADHPHIALTGFAARMERN